MGPSLGFMNRVYPSNRLYSHNNVSGRSSPGFRANGLETRPNGKSWNAYDEGRPLKGILGLKIWIWERLGVFSTMYGSRGHRHG